MTNKEFLAKLNELIVEIKTLPPEEAERMGLVAQQQCGSEGEIEDAFNFLRLAIKYLLLDVEATRRENNYLRQMHDG